MKLIKSMADLSPLARGTHEIKILSTLTRRFIPAGAGNTSVAR
ncbi:hypothetical protein CSC09_3939 [Escherichia coli]|nr:hypothetical protein CSC09_3939 [Escherichia coli]